MICSLTYPLFTPVSKDDRAWYEIENGRVTRVDLDAKPLDLSHISMRCCEDLNIQKRIVPCYSFFVPFSIYTQILFIKLKVLNIETIRC